MSNFLSGIAVVLSALAFILSGFTAYQVFGLRQAIESSKGSANNRTVAPAPTAPTPGVDSGNSSSQATAPVSSLAPPAPGGVGIQPGQFVQNAYGTKAQVELLSVKRIQDPEIGTRDVVNVQMRIRRVAEDVGGSNVINLGESSARNPDTSETYQPVDFLKRSSGVISLFSMRRGASADAYVWLRVPEGVNTLDIFIKETGAFKTVPISG